MKYLKVFTDFVKDMEPLSDDERGRLFLAMLNYAATGEETVLTGNERFIWGTAKKQIDSQLESYENMCRINKDNRLRTVTDRHEPSRTVTNRDESSQEQEQEKEQYKEKSVRKEKRFVPPTLKEVSEYIAESGFTVDPERFVNYYSSNGWKVGRNSMKDWKATIRNWQAKEPKKTQYSNSELEKLEIVL